MSFKEVAWVLDHSPYKLAARLVHIVLAERANEDNDHELWFSQTTIAAKSAVDTRTIRRTLDRMVSDGYLDVIEARPGSATRYRFVMPTPDNMSGVPVATPDIFDARPRTFHDPVLLLYKEDIKPRNARSDHPDPLRGFDHLWPAYPRRNGKRENRGKAEDQWRRLSLDDRRAAYRGTLNYAAACESGLTIAADAFRWLRDRRWVDWQEPAETSESTVNRPDIEFDPDRPNPVWDQIGDA